MAHPCLNCEAAEMELATRDITIRYKNLSAVLPAIHGWHCPTCGEIEFVDDESSRRHMDAMNTLIAKYKSETTAFIRSTRKKLHLTQKAASNIFGGGVNAFSEYERGVTQPHPSTLKLLHVLNDHPNLLKEIVAY